MDPFNNGSCRNAYSNNDDDLYNKKFGSIYSREVYEDVNHKVRLTWNRRANVPSVTAKKCLARIGFKRVIREPRKRKEICCTDKVCGVIGFASSVPNQISTLIRKY